MLEKELKCIITEEIYERVKAAFDWDYSAEQINYYYTDKGGILRKDRVMVRIRVREGVSKLQVKRRKNTHSPLQICDETEYEIDGVPETISARLSSEAVGFDVGELFLLGNAKTLRSSLMWDDETEICLDKTEYLGVTDYEIEIEYKGEPKNELTAGLQELGVVFEENSVGKFSRFMKKLETLNKQTNN